MTYIAPMTRDFAQRTPEAGEAAADRGADGGDEAAARDAPRTPQPPSGESEEEGGDAEGDASPEPAPQPMIYLSPRATTHTVAHSWRTDGGGGPEDWGGHTLLMVEVRGSFAFRGGVCVPSSTLGHPPG